MRPPAEHVVAHQTDILTRFRAMYEQRVPSWRTRFHGRTHLGHVLVRKDQDVVFFDFGGGPYLHISERRIKRCALRDVTSMLMSFGYAAQSSGRQLLNAEGHEAVGRQTVRAWGRLWFAHVTAAFVRSYMETAKVNTADTVVREQQQILLDTYLLERALLDVRSDVMNNPDLAGVPFRVIEENQRFRAWMKRHSFVERRFKAIAQNVEEQIDCTACATAAALRLRR